jgi:hypothetical protein
VGTYLGLAALNRVCEPKSTRAFADWWTRTALGGDHPDPVGALDHRRLGDAMDAVTVEEIEVALTRRMIEVFGLDTHALILDMTNFAAFIDSGNDPAPIVQRDKAKQKRYDLRIVGLGLVATRDGGIPLLSRAYPGNHVDVTGFTAMIEELARRSTVALGGPGATTLTFDAGQNSQPHFTRLAALGLHFVGSVPLSDHPGLLVRSATNRLVVPAYAAENLTAFKATAVVLGRRRRVILILSVGLHTAQQARFAQTLRKATRRWRSWPTSWSAAGPADLAPRSRPRSTPSVPPLGGQGPHHRPDRRHPRTMPLAWRIDQKAHAALEEEIFGKRILVTDHDN